MDDESVQLNLLGTTFRIKVENVETGVEVVSMVEVFQEDQESVRAGIKKSLEFVLSSLLDGGIMGTNKDEEQKQDLAYQKPEETDNLQKSARPSKDYCEDRGLDQDSLGKARE